MVDTRNMAAILLKVAGLVCIGLGVARMANFAYLMSPSDTFTLVDVVFGFCVTVLPLVLLGSAFWFFPGRIANRIVLGGESPVEPPATSALLVIAVTVIGLYLVAAALPTLTHVVLTIFYVRREDPSLPLAPLVARLASVLVEMAVGLWLCFGSKGIVRLVEKLRG